MDTRARNGKHQAIKVERESVGLIVVKKVSQERQKCRGNKTPQKVEKEGTNKQKLSQNDA